MKEENQQKGRNGSLGETEVPPKSLCGLRAGDEERREVRIEKEREAKWDQDWSWVQLYVGISLFPLSFPS